VKVAELSHARRGAPLRRYRPRGALRLIVSLLYQLQLSSLCILHFFDRSSHRFLRLHGLPSLLVKLAVHGAPCRVGASCHVIVVVYESEAENVHVEHAPAVALFEDSCLRVDHTRGQRIVGGVVLGTRFLLLVLLVDGQV
jgi:hypothetical protein